MAKGRQLLHPFGLIDQGLQSLDQFLGVGGVI
jgi:hypothetical protein